MITLYEGIEIVKTQDHPNGAGFTSGQFFLPDVIECSVTEERNGQFSLFLRYPIGGTNWTKIVPDAIIMAKPRPNASEEPFRIHEIEQVIAGVVTARANHLVYDLDGLSFAKPYERFANIHGISAVLDELTNAGQFFTRCFHLENDGITDTTTAVDFGNLKSITIWGAIGAVCAAFGAEMLYTWDSATNNCAITFCAARGSAKDTKIAYGVNIIAFDRKLDYSGLYSRVVAAWYTPDGTVPYLVQGWADTGYTGRDRALWIDVTDEFPTQPAPSTLYAWAQAYVDAHDWSPSSDLTVDFVPMENTTEYEQPPVVTPLTDSVPYSFRTSGGVLSLGLRNRETDSLIGGTVVWNQMVNPTSGQASGKYGNVSVTKNGDGSFTFNGTANARTSYVVVRGFTLIPSHKYYVAGYVKVGSNTGFLGFAGLHIDDGNGKIWRNVSYTSLNLRVDIMIGDVFSNVTMRPVVCDLTVMFGSTIADYVYTLESGTAGSGIAWLKKYGFFTEDYYPYAAASLQSVQASAHVMRDADDNIIGNYALDPIELRGIPKLDASNNLYYDGDTYEADGTVTRKYAVRAFQSGDATDGSTMITDGTNTVYKLNTSTTETADPYINPQVVDASGTEQYVDAGARDFDMPVGHHTEYTFVPKDNRLYLCDTATVDASLIGVLATAKCVRVVYNILTDMYDRVTVGTVQQDIVDTILKLGE